jgi:hypothetical protein
MTKETMMKLLCGIAFCVLLVTGCSSRNVPPASTHPGQVQLPPPGSGHAPQHHHIVNPPVLSANLSVPASALLSAAGMQQIAAGVAVQLHGVVLDASVTTYGQFLASVHRNHRSGFVDPNRQVWRVTYGLSNGLTTGGGVIAPGGQQVSIYDATDGRYLGSTYKGRYVVAFAMHRRVKSVR